MKVKLGDQISAHFEVEMPEYDYIDSTNSPSAQLMVTLIYRHLDSIEGLEVYNKFMDMTINPDQLEFTFCNDVKQQQFKAFLHSSEPIGMGDWDIRAKFGLVETLTFKPNFIILPF